MIWNIESQSVLHISSWGHSLSRDKIISTCSFGAGGHQQVLNGGRLRKFVSLQRKKGHNILLVTNTNDTIDKYKWCHIIPCLKHAFLAQGAINKCFKGEGWDVQKICIAAKIFFLLKIKWKVSWPDSDDKQGYYSLRRPPKLIIPQAVIRHWEKMSFCMHIDV